MTSIIVPERGRVVISAHAWNELRESEEFWGLVERKIVAARSISGGGAELAGSSFVGSSLCGGIRLDFVEKIPGAFAALLRFAFGDLRVEAISGPTADVSDTIRVLVGAFLEEVAKYVRGGRNWEYRMAPSISSLGGGRLKVAQTALLRARGLRHLVAFERPYVSWTTTLNRIIAAVLQEVETLSRLSLVSADQVTEARVLGALFADCNDHEVIFGSRARLAFLSLEQAQSEANAESQGLYQLAAALLLHHSVDPESPTVSRAPLSWFVNLERLFEKAVRRQLGAVFAPVLSVEGPAGWGVRVFPDAGLLDASPDLVISNPFAVVAVGDVKYKSWESRGAPSDLYQLLTHASAFKVFQSFLVYPADQFRSSDLGVAITGVAARLFGVSLQRFGEDVVSMAEVLRNAGFGQSLEAGLTQ